MSGGGGVRGKRRREEEGVDEFVIFSDILISL